jgi:predicted RNA-binding protein with PIN domain
VPILIDGHNLIGKIPSISLQDPDDEEQLVRSLIAYRARTGRRITVVFDPGGAFALPESRRYGGVEVVYPPQGSDADAVIARRVRRSRDRQSWLVVTSDQDLGRTVTALGARFLSAEAFAADLGPPPADATGWKDTPPAPEEVEAWLALFQDRD